MNPFCARRKKLLYIYKKHVKPLIRNYAKDIHKVQNEKFT